MSGRQQRKLLQYPKGEVARREEGAPEAKEVLLIMVLTSAFLLD